MKKSKYGRKCAICEGPLGPQCFGGIWTNDWCDFVEGKIPPTAIRESCQICYAVGEPPYMWGADAHDEMLARRRHLCELKLHS